MKSALILFGLSYTKKYKHPTKGYFSVDYRRSFNNYQKYIFKYFEDKGHELDVFLCTNNSIILKDLLKDYKPKNYKLIGDKKRESRYTNRNIKILEGVKLCLNYSKENNIKYKNIVITRFDLLFKKNFSDCNIQLNKFNFTCLLDREKKICDNFYLLPFKKLNDFYEILIKMKNESSHYISEKVETISEINIMFKGRYLIRNCPFYDFVRVRPIK